MVGTADKSANNSTLLPATFLEGFDAVPKPSGAVTIGGGDVQAYRYNALEPKDFDRAVTVYAAPTSAGVATVACVSPKADADSFATTCDQIANTLELSKGDPFPVGPSKDYAATVSKALGTLGKADKSGQAKLKSAKTPGDQAAAARSLSSAFNKASKTLAGEKGLSPADRGVNQLLVKRAARHGQGVRQGRLGGGEEEQVGVQQGRRRHLGGPQVRRGRARRPQGRRIRRGLLATTTRTERHQTMQPRQIAIVAAVVVVAFAVAFGIAGASGGGSDSGGKKAAKSNAPGTESVELASASVTVSMAGAAPLPALKSEPKKKKKSDQEGVLELLRRRRRRRLHTPAPNPTPRPPRPRPRPGAHPGPGPAAHGPAQRRRRWRRRRWRWRWRRRRRRGLGPAGTAAGALPAAGLPAG